MKNKRLRRIVLLCGIPFLIVIALFSRPERDHPALAFVGIYIPVSAVNAYGKEDMQAGYEDIIAFRLPLNRIPALMDQIQTKEHEQIGLYPRYVSPRIILDPRLAKFFAEVPKDATSAHFWFFQRPEGGPEYSGTGYKVDCSFAIDKATGRVWYYRRDIYS